MVVFCGKNIYVDLNERILKTTVNYLRVIDCEHGVANRNESYRKDHQSGNRNVYVSFNLHKNPKMTNSTYTNVIFKSAW